MSQLALSPTERLYSAFLRHTALRVMEYARGMPISRHLAELQRSQWWSPEALAALQWQRVQPLLAHAYAHVPLYRRLWDEHGVHPADLRGLHDLQRLPVISKAMLRAAYPAEAVAANVVSTELVRYASSGSTGAPLQFVMTRAEKGRRWANMFRCWSWAGAYRGVKTANVKDGHALGTFQHGFGQWLEQSATRTLNISAYAVHDERIGQAVADLLRFRPRVMFAYPGTAYHLAQALAARGHTLPLRSVITSGEMLHPFQREAIEKQFACRVYDYYGGEGMDVAMQCGTGQSYHINAESVIMEVVDDAGRPVPQGQEGHVVLTNLNAWAMPFIRYAVGDIAALAGGRCACGRGLPLMDHVMGRSSDQLRLPSGRSLVMWYFTDVFRRFPGVESFQMRQTAPDHIEVLIVPGAQFGYLPANEGQRAAGSTHSLGEFIGAQAAVQHLRHQLDEQVRGEATLDMRLVEAIPLGPGGKHRFFIAERQP
ncbi:MAG: hypothetical protein ABTQ73_08610 [Caldilineales bacterium]